MEQLIEEYGGGIALFIIGISVIEALKFLLQYF